MLKTLPGELSAGVQLTGKLSAAPSHSYPPYTGDYEVTPKTTPQTLETAGKVLPEGKYINKVIYGGKTLIDLTGDTISADKLLAGITAHDKSGAPITGSCAFDVDSTDATAAVAEILLGKTAYVRGQKLTGTMPNKGSVTLEIATADQEATIPQGYHDGGGKAVISAAEKAKLIADNIREGVTILGVEGSMSGSEDMKPQTKTITPST